MEAARRDSIDFFLGATTPAGFKGYFEPLRHEPGMQMYLIKSGPGCGKSTLMKRLARAAEQRGELTQRIHCASDPDSLDGVILPGQHRAIVDATAPHVVEPDAPGAVFVFRFHDDTEAGLPGGSRLRGRAAPAHASRAGRPGVRFPAGGQQQGCCQHTAPKSLAFSHRYAPFPDGFGSSISGRALLIRQ